MKVIIFDKDGVLIDSVEEVFNIASITYGLKENPKNLEKFKQLFPFVRDADDVYAVIKMIEENKNIFSENYNKKEAMKFRTKFYETRDYLIRHSFDEWITMIKPFKFSINALNELSKNYEISISTTSDLKSTEEECSKFNINVKKENMYTNQISTNKIEHFKLILKKTGVNFSDMFFIDNNIEQLKFAKPLGIKVALARWGSNELQNKEANALNIDVLEKDNILEQIRGLIK